MTIVIPQPTPTTPPTPVPPTTPGAGSATPTPITTPTPPQPPTGGIDPFSFAQVVNTMTGKMKENNKLFNNRNVLINHMYSSSGADPKVIEGLDPEVQELLKSGSRPEQEMYLRLVNDKIAGRNNSLDSSMKFLGEQYQASLDSLENNRKNAADAIAKLADIPGGIDAAKVLYPQFSSIFDSFASSSGYTGDLSAAIASVESGGRYDAVGPVIKKGSAAGYSALGKYQIMPNFWFDKIGLDPNNQADIQKFLGTPELQEKLHKIVLNTYMDKYGGDKGKAVAAYFGGHAGAMAYGTPQGDTINDGNLSINQYVNKVLGKMGGTTGGVGQVNPADMTTAVKGLKFNSVADRKNAESTITDLMKTGDVDGAKQQLKIYAYNAMSADEQQKVAGKEDALNALDRIGTLMADFEAQGGQTGIFTGLKQKTLEKGGFYAGPASDLANEIALAIVDYRKAVSGAAFTESEQKTYDAIFPSAGKVPELNQAKISTLTGKFNSDIDSAYSRRVPKYKEIFGSVAKTATAPAGTTYSLATAPSAPIGAIIVINNKKFKKTGKDQYEPQ